MEIHWQRDGQHGKIDATAFVYQDALKMGMSVRSVESDSRTILVQPSDKENGNPVLHYLYEVEPKAIGPNPISPYKGAAILQFYPDKEELSGNYWTSQQSIGHFKLTRKKQDDDSKIKSVDALVITAIPEEFDAAKKVFSAQNLDGNGVRSWERQNTPLHAQHWTGIYYFDGAPRFKIALAQATRMGALTTAPLAAVLADRLKPDCIVMCGVCAGNPADLALGDIIVSELAYQYDEGKLEVDGFVGDHRQSPITLGWLQAARDLSAFTLASYGPPTPRDSRYWLLERIYGSGNPSNHPARKRYFDVGEWEAMLKSLEDEGVIEISGTELALTKAGSAEVERSILMDVDPPVTLPLAIKVGPIASGNVVVKDGITWEKLKKMGVRSVLGLEMEAAAISAVARDHGISNWLVIKGVMDHADPKKDDRYKPFAARASAEALCQFLEKQFRSRG